MSKATSKCNLSDKTRKRVGGVGRVQSCVSRETRGVRLGPEKKKERDDRGSLKVAACGWFGVAKHAH